MEVRGFLAMAVLGLACAIHAPTAEAVKDCYVVQTPYGPKRICEERKPGPGEPDWVAWGLGDTEWDCRDGTCDRCGLCHVNPGAKVPVPFAAGLHMAKYTYPMKAGERISWASSTYVTTVGDRKCLVRDGRTLHCFPANALLLKGPKGNPVAVLTPAQVKSTTLVP